MPVPLSNRSRTLRLAACALAALAVAGCHGKSKSSRADVPQLPAAPTPTATITSTPQNVDKGDAVVLVWRTTDATEVSIDQIGPVNPNDQKMVQPQVTTTYHLMAKGDGGTADASVTVTVNGPSTAPAASSTATDTSSMTDEQAFHQNVQDLFFDYDSYDIRPDASGTVTSNASWLNAHPNVRVVIGGYCDDRGSTEYNIALGENRANAVKAALVKAGVSSSRLRVVSYGKEKQFCTEETESCWQQNRRAAFSLDQ